MMKRKEFLHLLGIGVILALLISVFLPVAPALAAARITLDPDKGRIGDEVEVTGMDFAPSDPVTPVYNYVDIYFTAVTTTGTAPTTTSDIDDEVKTYELLDDKVQVDDDGDFDLTFDVPDRLRDGTADTNIRGGIYYVCITYWGKDRIRAVAPFTITAGDISEFEPDSGPVGTEVDIAGQDFAERETISVKFDDKSINIASGDEETDSRGRFELSIVILASTAGDHTITVSDESLTDVEETFTVEPAITVKPGSVPPKKTAEVSGTYELRIKAPICHFFNGQ